MILERADSPSATANLSLLQRQLTVQTGKGGNFVRLSINVGLSPKALKDYQPAVNGRR
jgi:hypothetical protein